MVKFIWKAAALAAIILALAVLLEYQARSTANTNYNVILISVDALRADHLGAYGYWRDTSPNIDTFSNESVVFDNAVTPRPKTNPSVVSMLSGIYPYRHGVREHSVPVSDKTPLIQERLRDEGWDTAAFVSNWVLRPELSGLNRGFNFYDYDYTRPELNRRNIWERNAAETNDAVYKWLDSRRGGKFFLWIHYIDPHGPYLPPEGYRSFYSHAEPDWTNVNKLPAYEILPNAPLNGTFTDAAYYVDQYDSEVRYTDFEFGRLITRLRERGLLDKTLIILTSDHGEGLGEHDYYFEHGRELYEDNSRVPLIVRYPDGSFAGARVSELVSTMDVPPTVTEYLSVGWYPTAKPDGIDWAPTLEGKAIHDDVFIERKEYSHYFQRAAVRTKTQKFLNNGQCDMDEDVWDSCKENKYECYNLSGDPGELNPTGCGAASDKLREKLMSYLRVVSKEGMTLPVANFTVEDSGVLKSLGYMN